MDALRNSKKISLLAVAILFLYILFTLILDAPRTCILLSVLDPSYSFRIRICKFVIKCPDPRGLLITDPAGL